MEKIDNIIRDWFYELPNGYAEHPYSQKELKVLDEVLAKYGTSLNEIDQLDQAFLDAKPVKEKPVREFKWGSLDELQELERLEEIDLFESAADWEPLFDLKKVAKKLDKKYEFEEFKTLIDNAGIKPAKATVTVLKDLTPDEQLLFIDRLFSFTTPPKEDQRIKDPLNLKIFNIKAEGIGKGEVFCVWRYNAVIQGGRESFDLDIGGIKYETKDYSGTTTSKKGVDLTKGGAIRVGVEGSVSKFPVWEDILLTTRIVERMNKINGWAMLPGADAKDPNHTDWETLMTAVKHITKRLKSVDLATKKEKLYIKTGEFNKDDLAAFIVLYEQLDILFKEFDSKQFNQLDAKGPNQAPLTMVIAPIDFTDIPKNGGPLKVIVKTASREARPETIVNYWKKVPYVSSTYGKKGAPERSPEQFAKKLQAAVEQIIDDGQADYWMVFRGTKSNILMKIISKDDKAKFEYFSISQNGIKFKEPGEQGTGEEQAFDFKKKE